MRAVLVDGTDEFETIVRRLSRPDDPPVTVNLAPRIRPDELPDVLGDAAIALIDHTALPAAVARRCRALKHVVFLGTGARSYMNPEELAALGITVHTIKGYGDTAVAECAVALMAAAARDLARMDRAIRAGTWLRQEGMQLTGKTLGLIGFGSIAAEVARLATGIGMTVLAWNRTPRVHANVAFVPIERLLADSHVVSLHLLLNDETRGFLSAERIAALRPGAILINTARGALVDEAALITTLDAGRLRHAAMDVFAVEPLPADHPFLRMPNVTLSAHAAFLTPEASDNLLAAALDHCRRIAAGAP
ncbi:MAG: NAD(P)-dependent oxidoreductase [Xanthobacteraceae bacterium]